MMGAHRELSLRESVARVGIMVRRMMRVGIALLRGWSLVIIVNTHDLTPLPSVVST